MAVDDNSKELIIRSGDGEVDTLLENKGLIEYHQEKLDKGFNVGDLFLGRIKRLVPGLNAAFVDVGYEKDAFLHYHDLGPQASSLQKFISEGITGKRNSEVLKISSLSQILTRMVKLIRCLSLIVTYLFKLQKSQYLQKVRDLLAKSVSQVAT